jgi:hypothetical protein
MLENLVGDKKNFAIEYSIQSINRETAFGDCLIWLRGNSLGGLEGECFLNMICQWLVGYLEFKNHLFLSKKLSQLSEIELFEFLNKETESKIREKYFFLDTEGFDWFGSFIYRKEDNFHFLWQLDRYYMKVFELKEVSTELFTATVDINTYYNVVHQFQNRLLELYKTQSNKSYGSLG